MRCGNVCNNLVRISRKRMSDCPNLWKNEKSIFVKDSEWSTLNSMSFENTIHRRIDGILREN